MSTVTPERRTAMYHSQLAIGAVMADADGWQLPAHYGDASQESAWLRDTVGVSDVSPIGKVRVVGDDAFRALGALVPSATDQLINTVVDAESPLERGGRLLSVRLAPDEFLLLTPAGVAPAAIEAMRAAPAGLASPGIAPADGDAEGSTADAAPPSAATPSAIACAHAVDVTSGFCGVAIVGPASHDLFSRITEIDTSDRGLPDLTCVQSRFADVQALLLRRDVNGIAMYQLYATREYGEYLWEALTDTARDLQGGPVGTQPLLALRDTG